MLSGPGTHASSSAALALSATPRLLGAALASDGVIVVLPVARVGGTAGLGGAVRRMLARYRPRFVAYDLRADDSPASVADLFHAEAATHHASAFAVTRTETARHLGLDDPTDIAIAGVVARRCRELQLRTGLGPGSFRSPRSEAARYWTPAFLAVAVALVASGVDSRSPPPV